MSRLGVGPAPGRDGRSRPRPHRELKPEVPPPQPEVARAKQDGGNGFVSDTQLGPVGGPGIAAIN